MRAIVDTRDTKITQLKAKMHQLSTKKSGASDDLKDEIKG